MSSSLKKLWTHAKGSENDRLENFTTEALAAAIRADPNPLISVLQQIGALGAGPALVRPPGVHTQVSVKDVGVIDLVITLDDGRDRPEIWIEVKVEAGEHDGQLRRYACHIASLPEERRPRLVLLSPRPFDTAVELTQLRWQQIHRTIVQGRVSSPHWTDLRYFMEEFKMADEFDDRITAREVASLGDAYALLRKLDRVLQLAVEHAAKLMPAWDWPKSSKVRAALGDAFRKHGWMEVTHKTPYKAGVSMGSFSGEGETWLGVNVWCNPKATTTWKQIGDLAEKKLSKEIWSSSPEDWEVTAAYEYLASFETQQEMSTWLTDRLDELHQAGIIELVPTLGRGDPADIEARVGSADDEDTRL